MTIPIHGDALLVKNLHRPAFVSDTDPAAEDGQAAWKWWLEVDGSDTFVALHVRDASNASWITILTADVATNAAIAAAIAAVLDGATFTGAVEVPDEAYDATGWNGDLSVPTKNAVRDKIETLGGGAPSGPAGGVLSGTYPDPGFAADMATQAELDAAVAALKDGVSASFDTLAEIATELALKAPLASPALTGNPTAPTATLTDSDTSIATTAFAQGALSPWGTLSDGATITWDVAGKREAKAKVTLGGNRTLDIDNATDGSAGILIVTQDGSGDRTLALPAGSKIVGGGGTSPTLSTDGGAIDVLAFEYDGTTFWWTIGRGAA